MSARFNAPPPIPLSEDKGLLLARLVDGLDNQALWWLSGYSAGLAGNQGSPLQLSAPATTATTTPVTVVYGSQTGNARRVAEKLASDLESAGAAVRLLRADAFPVRELKSERLLFVVISTQGDGDPPDDARGLVDFIASKRAPQLPELRYAVLGLGDSSYPQFNAIGRKLDSRLAELGARRLSALAEADLDVETVADPWRKRAVEHGSEHLPAAKPRADVVPLRPPAAAPRHDRDSPFAAEVLANQRICGRGSEKDIRHLELSLEGSGLSYEPGDALGVWPQNPPELVDELIGLLELDGTTRVTQCSQTRSLRDWLSGGRELTRLSRPFVASHAAMSEHAGLNRLLAPEQSPALLKLLETHQLLDLIRAYPARWSAEGLVSALRPLAPRLYSIASSQKLVGDEAHLTVAHVDYQAFGRRHRGAASSWLADAAVDSRVAVYIERNERFRLPADGSRDIIMIGPGTGIAPFRAFVQERAATGASGRNWLLFGNPHFDSDFLYQVEWQEALREGRLDRLDLAFSRDQTNKVYVQHRLRENGRELHERLANGAYLYVCGDATRMARDVHDALVDVLASHGNGDRERAAEALEDIRKEGRYARDVY